MKKSPPKVVSIKLQSPHKQNKKNSPAKKQTFNSSFSNLKKTFNDNSNIYDLIKQDYERRKNQITVNRKNHQKLQQQKVEDQQIHPKLTQSQFRKCLLLFNILDKNKKQYTTQADLIHIQKQQLSDVLRVVYFRKQKNSFSDFVYALWDSQNLDKINIIA